MRIVDVIRKKRDGGRLNGGEIRFFVDGYVRGEVEDYQASALLMAVFLRGMDIAETTELTLAMTASGETADLSGIPGVKADKHSTGGVGDKTTLIAAPLAACLGLKVAKMSGRGLGFTGGTVDKLAAIPGYKTELTPNEFRDVVNLAGMAVIGQSGRIAPADKLLYALRDVTGTVESIPLIASSIMSKKLASGADVILLDVKTGAGAFMKTKKDADTLARAMVGIGKKAGRKCAALITDMNVPLGNAVGNILEVKEALEVLKGGGPDDLSGECVELAARMAVLGGLGSLEDMTGKAKAALKSGAAFEVFKTAAKAQGADTEYLDNPSKFETARYTEAVRAAESGYIRACNAAKIGEASGILGAGRRVLTDEIDYTAGVALLKKPGDPVKKGDVIAELHTCGEQALNSAKLLLASAITVSNTPPPPRRLILGYEE